MPDDPSGAVFMRYPLEIVRVQGIKPQGHNETRWRGSYYRVVLVILQALLFARPKKARTASTSDRPDDVNHSRRPAPASFSSTKGESDDGGPPLNTCGAAPIA